MSIGERSATKILVIGASRGIGLETVRTALRAGYSVRALARSAAGVPWLRVLNQSLPRHRLNASISPELGAGEPLMCPCQS
jgi:NAD(P)-dependent dehydrogenase (short-subunit alcohol dehydrogenase family)